MNIRIWNWITERKRLRKENAFLKERIKTLEKKEREMQILNVNMKRENDNDIAKLNKKHTNIIKNLEKNIETSLKREQQLKMELGEKKQAVAGHYNKLLSAQGEIKELHHQIAQLEAEIRRKKNK